MADLDRVYWKVLLLRCQVGDRGAFEELVAQCQPRLRAFLAKMLSGKANVDDVTQDVWMEVFRDLRKLNDPGAFLPWMYRIARNRAFRALRRKTHPTIPIDETDAISQATDERDFGADDARAVHAALDRLIPEHREVLLLRFIEDMSYDDIAKVIDVPIGTVRSRIHNAKRILRGIIEEGNTP
jgi:RNA polymerase sigma-70 factor (ECF subfamily)